MDNERSAEVLLYIDEDRRKKFLKNFSTKEIADNIINEIDSDDAADMCKNYLNINKMKLFSTK